MKLHLFKKLSHNISLFFMFSTLKVKKGVEHPMFEFYKQTHPGPWILGNGFFSKCFTGVSKQIDLKVGMQTDCRQTFVMAMSDEIENLFKRPCFFVTPKSKLSMCFLLKGNNVKVTEEEMKLGVVIRKEK